MKKLLLGILSFFIFSFMLRADNPIVSYPDEKEKTLFDSAVEMIKRYDYDK